MLIEPGVPPTLNYDYGFTLLQSDGTFDFGDSYYAGTLKLEIKTGACGDYVWDTSDGPDSFLIDAESGDTVPLTGIPLTIRVTPMADCNQRRLAAFSEFANCFASEGVKVASGCVQFDRDDDADVDLVDYSELFSQ